MRDDALPRSPQPEARRPRDERSGPDDRRPQGERALRGPEFGERREFSNERRRDDGDVGREAEGGDEGSSGPGGPPSGGGPQGGNRTDWRSQDKRRGNGRRGGRRRRRGRGGAHPQGPDGGPRPAHEGGAQPATATEGDRAAEFEPESGFEPFADEPEEGGEALHEGDEGELAVEQHAPARGHDARPQGGARPHGQRGRPEFAPRREQGGPPPAPLPKEGTGMLVKEFGGIHVLRQLEHQYLQSKADIFVPDRLVHQHRLREGAIVTGRIGRGQKHKYALNDVFQVDGKDPQEVKNLPEFKSLTSIDPDFHYAVGDATGAVEMRIMDILCPVGRGQRGLIVAPPRAGKTTILRQFAKGIEVGYPDVHLFVLLVDERPEEATEWKRATKGQVFVSTSDESAKTHVQLAEGVWKRCQRLVELGQDVVLLLDSITRLARAYNNLQGGSGRTMSGGLDAQAMERPRAFFGMARNTETAGSLTILGTTLVDTGSRMDDLIFEEFKGTGNMELKLSRKLADRRIFPAIDIEKSGTRKDEKLYSAKRYKQITTLRKVLLRMHFMESMELLITKLSDVETNDEFLKRFEVDPEA
ncbi:MAG: transcription termination factor Rho [Planctomycetes bacterium]|nr:transcription termination factor Rho [Planctomycetota bacterium]